MKIERYFLQAVQVALVNDRRQLHAAIGIRSDGAIVVSKNGHQKYPTPSHHAESRLCRKLGKRAQLVIVVRVNRQGQWMMSKPCPNCTRALERAGVKRILYSVGHEQYETL